MANKRNLKEKAYEFSETIQPVGKKRALFTKSRVILRDIQDLRYGLMYPAKLRVTYRGFERFFTDPEEAFKFAQDIAKDN